MRSNEQQQYLPLSPLAMAIINGRTSDFKTLSAENDVFHGRTYDNPLANLHDAFAEIKAHGITVTPMSLALIMQDFMNAKGGVEYVQLCADLAREQGTGYQMMQRFLELGNLEKGCDGLMLFAQQADGRGSSQLELLAYRDQKMAKLLLNLVHELMVTHEIAWDKVAEKWCGKDGNKLLRTAHNVGVEQARESMLAFSARDSVAKYSAINDPTYGAVDVRSAVSTPVIVASKLIPQQHADRFPFSYVLCAGRRNTASVLHDLFYAQHPMLLLEMATCLNRLRRDTAITPCVMQVLEHPLQSQLAIQRCSTFIRMQSLPIELRYAVASFLFPEEVGQRLIHSKCLKPSAFVYGNIARRDASEVLSSCSILSALRGEAAPKLCLEVGSDILGDERAARAIARASLETLRECPTPQSFAERVQSQGSSNLPRTL